MDANWTDDEIYLLAQRGYELASQGRYELAAVVFEGLLAVAPGNAYARRAMAAVQIQSGAAAAALKTLDGLPPADRDARSRVLRLEALVALDRWKDAGMELSSARSFLDARDARRFTMRLENGRSKQLSGPRPDK